MKEQSRHSASETDTITSRLVSKEQCWLRDVGGLTLWFSDIRPRWTVSSLLETCYSFLTRTLTRETADYTSINLTKREYIGLRFGHALEADSKFSVDVLDTFPTIRVAVAYGTAQGEKLTSFPADLSLVSGSPWRPIFSYWTRIPARQLHSSLRRLSRLAKLH